VVVKELCTAKIYINFADKNLKRNKMIKIKGRKFPKLEIDKESITGTYI